MAHSEEHFHYVIDTFKAKVLG